MYSDLDIDLIRTSLAAHGGNSTKVGEELAPRLGRKPETIARKACRVRAAMLADAAHRETKEDAIKELAGTYNVLCIPDLHHPASHPDALRHCKQVYAEYDCNLVVVMGDWFDLHSFGRWDVDPDAPGPANELEEAIQAAQPWYHAFPNALCCVGNHDTRIAKKAFRAGMPTSLVHSISTIYQCPPGWRWNYRHTVDGVVYMHGNRASKWAVQRVMQHALELGRSCVIGHHHFGAGVQYLHQRDEERPIFGMATGAAIDDGHRYFEYASSGNRQAVAGCGVVLKGRDARFIPMGG